MDYCKMKGWGMEKTSAKQDVNIQDSFSHVIKSVLRHKFGFADEKDEAQKEQRPDIIIPSVPTREQKLESSKTQLSTIFENSTFSITP
jgi:hypothetical protein